MFQEFCICLYLLGCRLSLFRLCGNDFGITLVDDIINRITCGVFCFHIAHISFASSWYLFSSSVVVLARLCVRIWDSYVYQKDVFFFLYMNVVSGRLNSYCFVRKYAAVPVQLEIVIFQYTGCCVYSQYGLFSSVNSAASASF